MAFFDFHSLLKFEISIPLTNMFRRNVFTFYKTDGSAGDDFKETMLKVKSHE